MTICEIMLCIGFVTLWARSRYLIRTRLSNTLTVTCSGSLLCLACRGRW